MEKNLYVFTEKEKVNVEMFQIYHCIKHEKTIGEWIYLISEGEKRHLSIECPYCLEVENITED